MNKQFTVGIEEEFQIIDPTTRELCPRVDDILREGSLLSGPSIKSECHSSMVEISSGICPGIPDVRMKIMRLRKTVSDIAEKHGIRLAAAGTHPFSKWEEQHIQKAPLFEAMQGTFKDLIRSNLVFGLHVHIGIEDRETAIQAINRLRPHLPLLLALSVNSPFWRGRDAGYKSYRSVLYGRFPRTGIPDYFDSYPDYKEYINILTRTGCLPFPGKIWWDARIHPFYETVEIRICDMPTGIEETISFAALIQALVAQICRDYREGIESVKISTSLIDENRWRAARYGIQGKMVDFESQTEIECREATLRLLEYVSGEARELGTSGELEFIQKEIIDGETGADRQLGIFQNSEDLQAVVDDMIIR